MLFLIDEELKVVFHKISFDVVRKVDIKSGGRVVAFHLTQGNGLDLKRRRFEVGFPMLSFGGLMGLFIGWIGDLMDLNRDFLFRGEGLLRNKLQVILTNDDQLPRQFWLYCPI